MLNQVRTGETPTLQIVVRAAALDGRILALDTSVRSTTVWTTPESLEKIATLIPSQALSLRAQAQQLRLLAATKTPARIAEEMRFGSAWTSFFQNWSNVKKKLDTGEGSNEQQDEALDVYESEEAAFEKTFAELQAQTLNPAPTAVTLPKVVVTPYEQPSVKAKGGFTALWVLGLVGVFGLVKLVSK